MGYSSVRRRHDSNSIKFERPLSSQSKTLCFLSLWVDIIIVSGAGHEEGVILCPLDIVMSVLFFNSTINIILKTTELSL